MAINWLFHPTITIVVLGEGTDYDKDVSDTEKRNITTVDTLMDLVRNLFPENIIQASLEKVQTVSIYPGAAIVFDLYDNLDLRDLLNGLDRFGQK